MVALDPQTASTPPVWIVYDNGAEIHQTLNSDPAIAVGMYVGKALVFRIGLCLKSHK